MDNAQDSLSQLAARWYARLRAPDCTAAERAQFDEWRASDPRNAAAYAAAERMNDALTKLAMADPRLQAMVDRAASSGATIADDEQEEPPAGKPPPIEITTASSAAMRPRRIMRRFAWAASIGVAILSVFALLGPGSGEREPAENNGYADARPVLRYSSGATRRAVTLDDGTRVSLDVASIIEVRFDTALRDVTLVQGRAVFAAAIDPARPFVVTVGTERVTALGTVFQVDRTPSEIVVTLAEGAGTVTSQTTDAAVRLSPGEELRSSASGTAWEKRTVDARSATSWSLAVRTDAEPVPYSRQEVRDRAQF